MHESDLRKVENGNSAGNDLWSEIEKIGAIQKLEASLSKEQQHLIRLAVNSAIAPIYETGNVFPTIFVHEGDRIRYFTIQIDSLEALREVAKKTIAEKCEHPVAYAFVYDTSVEEDGECRDALAIESGHQGNCDGLEYIVRYDRQLKKHDDYEFFGPVENILAHR
jgi:hypothetical protein